MDAIKHAFITKFNGIKPEIYQRFANILSRELLATKSRVCIQEDSLLIR